MKAKSSIKFDMRHHKKKVLPKFRELFKRRLKFHVREELSKDG